MIRAPDAIYEYRQGARTTGAMSDVALAGPGDPLTERRPLAHGGLGRQGGSPL